jgi:hypothetical protein
MISKMDALFGGLNTELSPKATIVRRPGFSKYDSQQFAAATYPLTFYTFKNVAGTIKNLVDTPGTLKSFTSSALTTIFTKTGGAGQTSFITGGNQVYFCDGVSTPSKWDGTTVTNWGIVTPAVTPGISTGAGVLSPTSGYSYVYAYYNSTTGHISSASAASANTGPLTSKNITVSYTASGDSQVTNIWIFRTVDGGSLYYFLAQVANTTTSYTDSTADSGLNTLLIAPISGVNNPPPAGMAHVAFYAGYAWGSVGNVLYFSNGPNTTLGSGTESWPASNNFTLPGAITCIRPTSVGLAVFTRDDLYLLAGSSLSTFTLLPWQANFGVPGENCVCQDGDVLYCFTTRAMLYQIQYGQGIAELGFNIRQSLGAMTPGSVYLTLHRNGGDEGLFVSDGSANVWRYGMDFGAWSPVAQPTQGAGALGSIETSTANWTLLMGAGSGSGYIWNRQPGTYTDNGTGYDANVIIGSLVVAPSGQFATPEKIMVLATNGGAGYNVPAVNVLPNNISGAFTNIPHPVGDPPALANTPYESTTMFSKAYHWKAVQSPLPQYVQNLQIQVDFGSETVQSELLAVGLL